MININGNIETRYIEPGDQEGLLQAFKLRYAVYCEEKRFIDKEQLSDREEIETDEYDKNLSWHFVVLNHYAEGKDHVIGTVRLVRYSEEKGFPTGKFHPELYQKLAAYDKSSIAEISRLCINPCFRRRRDDDLYGVTSYNTDDVRRKYPIVLLSLLREMYWFSKKMGIKYWLSSMEDTLYRYLKGISLEFTPLDDDYIEYYGKVKSFLMRMEDAEKKLEERRGDLYVFFQASHGNFPAETPNGMGGTKSLYE